MRMSVEERLRLPQKSSLKRALLRRAEWLLVRFYASRPWSLWRSADSICVGSTAVFNRRHCATARAYAQGFVAACPRVWRLRIDFGCRQRARGRWRGFLNARARQGAQRSPGDSRWGAQDPTRYRVRRCASLGAERLHVWAQDVLG